MFRVWYGHFKYQVMFFRLTNTPVSFQGFINKILTKKLDIFVIMYLSKIFIYINNDRDGHITASQRVLKQLKNFHCMPSKRNIKSIKERFSLLAM